MNTEFECRAEAVHAQEALYPSYLFLPTFRVHPARCRNWGSVDCEI